MFLIHCRKSLGLCNLTMGETAATEGGMRRAKYAMLPNDLEKNTDGTGSKTLRTFD